MNIKILCMVSASWCCLVFGGSVVGQTDTKLTVDGAMELLNAEVGRWEGTRDFYQNGENSDPVQTKVTIVNRIEGDAWLYFQSSETSDNGTLFSKGTLAFNPDTGGFTRRWFSNNRPEIYSLPVSYDAEPKKLTFTWTVPDSAPVNGAVESTSLTYTTETMIRDDNIRIIKTYSVPADGDLATPTLQSELTLARVAANGEKSPSATPTKKGELTLLVKVKIASNDLEQGQDPTIKIEPADAEPKRIDASTFEFSGLKPGVEYTVSGEFTTQGAFKIKTTGTTSYTFPNDIAQKTKILALEKE